MKDYSDILFNLGILKNNIGFTFTGISIIAIGLAIVLPLISYTDNSYFKSLPFPESDKFVAIKDLSAARPHFYDAFTYRYLKENVKSYQAFGAYKDLRLAIGDGNYSEVRRTAEIEPALLTITGVQPILGRTFSEEDGLSGSIPVVMISYGVWRNMFLGRQDVIGDRINVNGEMRSIIGVMPEGFGFPFWHDLWIPLQTSNVLLPGAGEPDLILIGKLSKGTTRKSATNEIQSLFQFLRVNWEEEYGKDALPESLVTVYASIESPLAARSANVLVELFILLLIPINLSNLFIARGEERIQELGLRSALGCPPVRVAKILMQETLVISFLGLLLGLFLSMGTLAFLDGFFTNIQARRAEAFWWDLSLNFRLLVIAALSTVVIWISSSILPVWKVIHADLSNILSQGGPGVTGTSVSALNRFFVNFQLILGSILLTLSVVVVLALPSPNTVNVVTDDLYSGRIDFSDGTYTDDLNKLRYIRNLEQSLMQQSGVGNVGFSTSLPNLGAPSVPYSIEGNDVVLDEYPSQYSMSISNNYFKLLNVSLVDGRLFGAEDDSDSQLVAIIDTRLSEMYWPGQNAIGKRLRIDPEGESELLTIVGIVEPVIQETALYDNQEGLPVVYRPIQQTVPQGFYVLYKSNEIQSDFNSNILAAGSQADRDLPIMDIQSLTQEKLRISRTNSSVSYVYFSLIVFALYLTGIATYSIASRSVTRRMIEVGVRMALGADNLKILQLFIFEVLTSIAAGLITGGLVVIFLGYYTLTFLNAPFLNIIIWAFLLVSAALGLIIVLANYLPLKRFMRMEPYEVLRYQ